MIIIETCMFEIEMSIAPLLEILCSESKIVSDKNAARIHVNIIT